MQIMTRQPCYGDDSDYALFITRGLTALAGKEPVRARSAVEAQS